MYQILRFYFYSISVIQKYSCGTLVSIYAPPRVLRDTVWEALVQCDEWFKMFLMFDVVDSLQFLSE